MKPNYPTFTNILQTFDLIDKSIRGFDKGLSPAVSRNLYRYHAVPFYKILHLYASHQLKVCPLKGIRPSSFCNFATVIHNFVKVPEWRTWRCGIGVVLKLRLCTCHLSDIFFYNNLHKILSTSCSVETQGIYSSLDIYFTIQRFVKLGKYELRSVISYQDFKLVS